MKKKLLSYVKASALIIALISSKAVAQTAATATWSLLTDQTAVVTGSVLATNQALGSTIVPTTPATYGSPYGTSGSSHNISYQRVGTSPGLPQNAADLTNGYLQYIVNPTSGNDLMISNISFAAVGGGSGSVRIIAQYSLDGFTTTNNIPVSASYNALSYAATGTDPIFLINGSSTSADFAGNEIATFTGFSIFVPNGKTFSLRIFPYTAASSNKYLANKNVVITGTTTTSGTLPLDFLSLSGKADGLGKTVDLNWNTTNEVNTKSFEVQRKIAGSDFATIGSLASKNTAGVHHYSFTDQNAANGTAYYRILQSDHDGASKLSSVIAVSNKAVSALSVYPNPAEQTLNINHSLAAIGANLKVLSLDGKTIFQKAITTNSTSSNLDVSKLVTGTYLLILDNNSEKSSMKFIKK